MTESPEDPQANLQYQINYVAVLLWLQAEKHYQLVAQLQTMVDAVAGTQGGSSEAVHDQMIKQRAIRIGQIRAANDNAATAAP